MNKSKFWPAIFMITLLAFSSMSCEQAPSSAPATPPPPAPSPAPEEIPSPAPVPPDTEAVDESEAPVLPLSSPPEEDEQTASSVNLTAASPEGPPLPTTLKRGCTLTDTQGDFDDTGPAVGELAIDFALRDTSGKEFTLSGLLAEKPVVIVLGSFT